MLQACGGAGGSRMASCRAPVGLDAALGQRDAVSPGSTPVRCMKERDARGVKGQRYLAWTHREPACST